VTLLIALEHNRPKAAEPNTVAAKRGNRHNQPDDWRIVVPYRPGRRICTHRGSDRLPPLAGGEIGRKRFRGETRAACSSSPFAPAVWRCLRRRWPTWPVPGLSNGRHSPSSRRSSPADPIRRARRTGNPSHLLRPHDKLGHHQHRAFSPQGFQVPQSDHHRAHALRIEPIEIRQGGPQHRIGRA